ncbi:hypothetical protein [Burkholderia stagnalis]
MDPDPLTRLHRPEPPLPDVEPDPVPPDENDDLPPDLPEPYRHPEGDPPEHRPPEREPPGRKPPVRAPPASACRPSACAGDFHINRFRARHAHARLSLSGGFR